MASKVTCTCGWSWNKSDSSKKDMYVCHQCGKDNTMKNGGWLSKFDVPEAENGIEGTMGGLTDKGFNYNGAWGGPSMQGGGKIFLEPTSEKLPLGFIPPSIVPSSEVAMSIGGVGDEPAYLIPSFKYGQRSKDPIGEFDRTGEHLGGPFKTYQEADEWERTVRHPYVEKGQSIPSPYRRWGKDYDMGKGEFMQMGGSIPGTVGFSYARTQSPAPSKGKYAKKTMASAQDGKKISYNQWKRENNLKETPDYNLKRAWELGYTPDKTGHLPTVDNQTGKFLKAKGHPTLKLELDWYNSPAGAEFKSKNTLDSTGKFFKYVPKLQNGQEMKFYQEGLDWKPKTISRDGSIIEDDLGQWAHPGEITKINSNQITMQGVDYPVLGISDTGDTQMMQPGQDYTYEGESVTEIPMMQKGGKASLRSLMNDDDLKSKSDATKVVKATAPNKVVGSPTRDQGTISVPYEKSIREKAISNLKQYDDPVRGLVTAPAVSALNLLRPDRYFENVNSESDIKDAFLNFGLDAAMVAPIAGEFSPYINKTLKSARQYLPEKGQFINEIKDLKRAIAPTQPTFINPIEQELLSTVRNVGIMSKTGANDATVLEKILNKSAQLGEKEFESLVGSTRSQIQEKIQAIKASGSAKKPNVNTETTIASELGIDQDPSWLRIQERLRDRARSTSNFDENGFPLDEVGNIISEPSSSDIARAIQSGGDFDLASFDPTQIQRARRVQELMANSFDVQPTTPSSYFSLENTGSFDFSGLTNKSLIRGLTERVNKNKYLPLVADDSDSLLPVLYRDASNNPAVEMLKAYRTLESAPKGSTFKGASSLSTDSYPATLRLTKKALKNDIADVNYIGMGDLNFSGFSQIANVPKDVNLKEINTMIDKLNKTLPKPIPYAYEKGNRIVAPQITVTRKKNGGWLSKYN